MQDNPGIKQDSGENELSSAIPINRIMIQAPNFIHKVQNQERKATYQFPQYSPEYKEKSISKQLLPTKNHNLNSEIEKIRNGNATISFTSYTSDSLLPRKLEIQLENPKISQNSIILTGAAAKEFNKNKGKYPLFEDLYNLSLEILNNKKFNDKNAFKTDNPIRVQEIFISLKCNEISSIVKQNLLKEKDTLHELQNNVDKSIKHALFTSYKREKVVFLDDILRNGYFNYKNLKSDLPNISTINKLKSMSSEYFINVFGQRNSYQESLRLEKQQLIKASQKVQESLPNLKKELEKVNNQKSSDKSPLKTKSREM